MKVLFIQPTSDKRGHYGLWTNQLCQAIAKQGHDLHLLTNRNDPTKYLKEPPQFNTIEVENGKYEFGYYDEIKKTKPWWYWYGYFKTSFVIVKAALKLCQQQQFDGIFLTDTEYLMATLLLKLYKKNVPPVVWHVQAANFTYDAYCGSAIKKIYKVFQRELFKTVINNEVKGFAVLGQFHQEQLRQQLNITSSFPVEIVPDGAEIIEEKINQAEARKKVNINGSGLVFLFLGILRKDKGLEYLIEALSYMKDKEFKVIIAGAPFEWSVEQIQSLIDRYDVSSKVILRLDYISDEDVPYYYFASDVVLFPYTNEYTGGCGPLIKGASAHSKPVIVTQVSDIARVVKENNNGLIVAPCDGKAYADAMMNFMRLPQDAKHSMVFSAESLARKHSWPNVARTFCDLMQQVVLSSDHAC